MEAKVKTLADQVRSLASPWDSMRLSAAEVNEIIRTAAAALEEKDRALRAMLKAGELVSVNLPHGRAARELSLSMIDAKAALAAGQES